MNKRLLRDCLRISQNNLHKHPEFSCNTGSYYHWSFIVQRNKIVEYATNSTGKPPKILGAYYKRGMWDDFIPKRHSEYNCYMKAKGLLIRNESWEIVNIRLRYNGVMAMSQPCTCCHNFMHDVGCSKCFFSTDMGFAKIQIGD